MQVVRLPAGSQSPCLLAKCKLDRSGDEPCTVGAHGPGQFTGDIDILTRRLAVVGAFTRGETEVLGVSSLDVRRIIGERPRLGETV